MRPSLGVEGVAVIAPPYFPLDEEELLAHFTAAARACAPTPFYAYELERASGYAIPPVVVERLRDTVDNVVGMKVSDAPFREVEPYLLDGPRRVHRRRGADRRRARSGCRRRRLRARIGVPGSGRRCRSRAATRPRPASCGRKVDRFPRHAALKEIVRARGVPMTADVRPPLRGLTDAERDELLALVSSSLARRSPGGRAFVHVGAPVGHVGLGLGFRLRLRTRGSRRASRAGRPQASGPTGAAAGRRRLSSAPRPSRTEDHGEEALHAADATLPPLLAPSVAPSSRSGAQETGPTKTVGRRIRV